MRDSLKSLLVGLCAVAVLAWSLGSPAALAAGPGPATGTSSGGLQLAQAEDADDVNDPLEPVNRIFFVFNEGFQNGFLRPLAYTYNDVFPQTFRLGLRNFLDHLATPVTLANDLLQFEFERAVATVTRFMINTVGLVGVADLASELGVEEHKEDFGQTLAVWGVGEGPYLVLPLLGPSNPRDAVGRYVVDPYLDPLGLWFDNTGQDGYRWGSVFLYGFTEYAGLVNELDEIKKTSVDYYAALRSLYRQRRAAEIANGAPQSLPSIPDYDLNFDSSEPVEPVAGLAPSPTQ